eukprot:6205614-Pleurochrysis_carterae.AAC.4
MSDKTEEVHQRLRALVRANPLKRCWQRCTDIDADAEKRAYAQTHQHGQNNDETLAHRRESESAWSAEEGGGGLRNGQCLRKQDWSLAAAASSSSRARPSRSFVEVHGVRLCALRSDPRLLPAGHPGGASAKGALTPHSGRNRAHAALQLLPKQSALAHVAARIAAASEPLSLCATGNALSVRDDARLTKCTHRPGSSTPEVTCRSGAASLSAAPKHERRSSSCTSNVKADALCRSSRR